MTPKEPKERRPENVLAGEELRAKRQANSSLSQDALADLANIDRSRYNALENGRETITATYAERITAHLKGVSPEDILPVRSTTGAGSQSPLDRLAKLEVGAVELGDSVAMLLGVSSLLAQQVVVLGGQVPAEMLDALRQAAVGKRP